ncbi:phage portal protein [uncultured Novosphingobium sp.]|uniref:phage portal protein n=1 Tax=uncultured Novosphingobium sp. TaxID=292277 RepID=UPI003748E560
MRALGYELSAQAAAAEMRARAPRDEIKDIVVSGYAGEVAQANRDDFATNRITVAEYRDSVTANGRAAMGLSTVWACVGFWAGNIAGLPLHVRRRSDQGVSEPAPDHPLYWLLHDSPNFDQSAYDFWEFMVAGLELHGNAYAQIVRRDDGGLGSLIPIPPDIVSVARISDGNLQYSWRVNGRPERVGQYDMLHIRGFGGDPLGGLSPLALHRRTLGLAGATEDSASTIFRNGVRSSGALSTEEKLNGEQRAELEERLQDRFAGAHNAGRPMLLDNKVQWVPFSISPVDAEMIEARGLSMVQLCQIWEVDPHLVGITTGNTQLGSSITDQTLSLVKFKMRKRLKRIEGALEKQLLSRADRRAGVSIEFNLEGFLRADSAGRASFYQTMTGIGAMTINEVRALEGLPPVAGGETPRMQMQNQPIDQAGQEED